MKQHGQRGLSANRLNRGLESGSTAKSDSRRVAALLPSGRDAEGYAATRREA